MPADSRHACTDPTGHVCSLKPFGIPAEAICPVGPSRIFKAATLSVRNRLRAYRPGRLRRAIVGALPGNLERRRSLQHPRTADGEIADVFEEPPDAAIEIVSPQQSINAVLRRCVWYVEHGVRLALLVDPVDRSVVRFDPGHAPHALRGEDRIDFEPALRGFSMTVDDLFGSLRLDA